MNYHIGRMLIDENFDDKDFCPICRIKSTLEKRLAETYLGEAVMEDETRKEVNDLGFCSRHFDILYKMPSKLGLALQTHTRVKTLYKSIITPVKAKNAKKFSEKIEKSISSCVICKYLNEHLIRYYKTVAEVYFADEKFKEKLLSTKGFCLTHYENLIKYSSYARNKADEYLKDLYKIESESFEKLENSLEAFCTHYDYRKSSEPLGENKNALPNARKTLYETEV